MQRRQVHVLENCDLVKERSVECFARHVVVSHIWLMCTNLPSLFTVMKP
jgi:hypothetical protein